MPDIYVPYDADEYPDYYNKLLDRGLIFRYAFQYTDTHRQKLSDYEQFDDFEKYFTVHKGMFLDFIEFAEEKGVPRDDEGIRESDQRIKTLIKAYIGRNLFNDDGFYPIYHQIDETFQEAVKHLASKEDKLN